MPWMKVNENLGTPMFDELREVSPKGRQPPRSERTFDADMPPYDIRQTDKVEYATLENEEEYFHQIKTDFNHMPGEGLLLDEEPVRSTLEEHFKKPSLALAYRAYLEDSHHALPPQKDFILCCFRFGIANLKS